MFAFADQEKEFNKALRNEWKEGREEGISGTVDILREMDVDDRTIAQKIKEKYNLTPEADAQYLKKPVMA